MAATRKRIGAHMSVAGGMPASVERALSVDATALQVFVKSSRQWVGKPIDPDEAARFRQAVAEVGLEDHTLAHASYLINLATTDPAMRERSIAALSDELERCELLDVPYLVVHPGSHLGRGIEPGLSAVVEGLDRVLERPRRTSGKAVRRGRTSILLENTAGQGATLGRRFEELAFVIERVTSPERVGVCFDTCHALAAGYEFRDRSTYRRTLAELDRVVGLARVRAVHLNDSRHGLGSRRDRHEHIGRGEVGLEAFRLLLNDSRLDDRPMVLETPKGPDLEEDRLNLAVLREMLPVARR